MSRSSLSSTSSSSAAAKVSPSASLVANHKTSLTRRVVSFVEFHVDDTRRGGRTSRRTDPSSHLSFSSLAPSSSSSGSDHSEYRVSVTTHFHQSADCVVVVWRRYSQFLRFYNALMHAPRFAAVMAQCPEFPPKATFGRFSEEVIEHRRKRFQALMDFIAFNQPLMESSELLAFLTDTSNDPPAPASATAGAANGAEAGSRGNAGASDAQEDSLRSFALGRLYDHLDLPTATDSLRGRVVSFLSISSTDIVPLLAVATEMAKAGVKVQVISMENNKVIVEAHKLKFMSLSAGDTYVSLNDLRTSTTFSLKSSKEVRQNLEISLNHLNLIKSQLQETALLCFGQGFPETVISSTLAQALRIPVVGLFLLPSHHTSRDQLISILDLEKSKPLHVASLIAQAGRTESSWKPLKGKINEWRAETLNLPPIQIYQWEKTLLENIPVSYGISPSLFESPADWNPSLDVAGYWYLETSTELRSRKKAIHPLATVQDSIVQFINSGPKPMFIGFDTSDFADMAQEERSKFFNLLMDALRESGLRTFLCFYSPSISPILINEIGVPTSASVYRLTVSSTIFPFLWLFSHCQAVIHDASFEMASHSLRAGVPVFSIPFQPPQLLLSTLISRLGVGPTAIQYSQLNGKNFFMSLRRLISDKELKIRAEVLGEQLRQEQGCLRTLDFIQEHFVRHFKSMGLAVPALADPKPEGDPEPLAASPEPTQEGKS